MDGRRTPGGARPARSRGEVLARVRAATSGAHERLDASLDVSTAPWDRDVHRRWLRATWGLHAPLERGLAAWAAGDPAALDVAARRRADLALADLRVLDADLDGLAECPDVPRATTRAAALGTCYVLDGSTLGGRLITRAAVAAGVPVQACTSLTGRPGSGRRWRETLGALDAVADDEVEEVVAAAVATFAAHERWLAPLASSRVPAAARALTTADRR